MSAELRRMIAALLSVGTVAELDAAAARVRCDVDGILTDWLPWMVSRSGAHLRTWSAPAIGEQVVIAAMGGDYNQGVVIGSLYQDAHAAPESADKVTRATFADGTTIAYSEAENLLTVDVGAGRVVVNCKTATVTATESVTLDTPDVYATGNLDVTGAIKAGDSITTPADVKAGAISLKNHKHTAQGATAPTTAAQA